MKSAANKKSIYFIFVTITLDMVGIGLIMPVLPDVLRRFISDPTELTKLFGYFVAVYALMQFFASPILGSLSDRYGRRSILLISLLGSAVDYVFMAVASTLPLLFIGRVISGLTGASMTVANSYIADISDDSNRSANFGMIGAAFGIGFIAGPVLGGALGHFGPTVPFIAAAILNFLNFLFGLFILPESLAPEHRRPFELKKINPFVSIVKILKPSPILVFILTYSLLVLAGSSHPSIWTLYTEYKFGWSPLQVGLSLSFVGLIYGVSQAVLTKKLVPIWGENKALIIGLIFNAIGFTLYAFATHGWMVYAIMLGSCLAGLTNPCLQSIMTKKVEANRQGELQGDLVALSSLAAIAAPILYTATFNLGIRPDSPIPFAGLPYLIAAAFVVLSWILLRRRLSNEA
ncbi:MAG: TCR/Tet family MFS transporter [Bdellovibrio sp.]|nr:TCR/Tet family MFS transporter [Bdellovibrio sp.]